MAQTYGEVQTYSDNGDLDFQVGSRHGLTCYASVVVYGDLGGGTITLKKSHDGTNFVDVYKNDLSGAVTISTTDTGTVINMGAGGYLRATLAGATSPTASVSVRA